MTSEQDDIRNLWTTRSPVPLNPSAAIAGADYAIDHYGKLGARQRDAGDRLQQARNFLTQFSGTKAPLDLTDEQLLHRICESTQTCFEHYLIARTTYTPNGKLSPDLVRKLKESLTGVEVADEEVNSPGRDTQFELFVRAMLVMGDVPVRIAEPDLRFPYDGREVGIAAKRVKRPAKLRRRFKDAVDQIERTGHSGFVAVNADLLVRDLGPGENATEVGAHFQERLDTLKRIDEEFAPHPLVMGRLVFGTDTIWHPGKEQPMVEFRSFRQYYVYPKSDEEAKTADRFFPALMERIDERMQKL
jgi:hypothetical protein